jgi:serine protease AprX
MIAHLCAGEYDKSHMIFAGFWIDFGAFSWVGALYDAHTVGDWSDDYIPAFSATGPAYEVFVKPDVIAPGCHVVGLMPDNGQLALDYPDSQAAPNDYRMGGASMSAAQVSGVVALMLAQNSKLTPNKVEYRLMASVLPAIRCASSTWPPT